MKKIVLLTKLCVTLSAIYGAIVVCIKVYYLILQFFIDPSISILHDATYDYRVRSVEKLSYIDNDIIREKVRIFARSLIVFLEKLPLEGKENCSYAHHLGLYSVMKSDQADLFQSSLNFEVNEKTRRLEEGLKMIAEDLEKHHLKSCLDEYARDTVYLPAIEKHISQ